MTNVNGGVNNFGGTNEFHAPVAGRDIVYGSRTASGSHTASGQGSREGRADVGVLTILPQEMRAVEAALRGMSGYRERRLRHDPLAREAWMPGAGGHRIRVAAVQTLTRGTESAAIAYRGLVEEYNPSVVLLVGIAGGVGKDVHVGDVVVSDEVISYDARRVAADGTHRRGQAQSVAAPLGHRLNDFSSAVPVRQTAADGSPFRIHRGPIGSGNAVVTDARSEIRRWLSMFNEKVLAVETEAAGVAQSFHESVAYDAGPRGWLTVRGISDTADVHKGHADHDLAAGRAAQVMSLLLPYLDFAPVG